MPGRRGRALAAIGLVALAMVPAAARATGPRPAPGCPAGGGVEEEEPGRALTMCVVTDHARREGAFVVVDALVKNVSSRPITHAQVSVELYSKSGRSLAGESTILRPDRLDPGQQGSVLVIAPYQDGMDQIRYRIAWQQAGRPHRGVTEPTVALTAPPAGDSALVAPGARDSPVIRAGARAATRAARARDPAWPRPRS